MQDQVEAHPRHDLERRLHPDELRPASEHLIHGRDSCEDSRVTIDELRAQARLRGIDASDEDLEGVRDFLSVFLPAVEELAQLLPPDASGPEPLE